MVYAKPEKIMINVMDGEMNSTYEGLVGRFSRQNIKTDREKSQANKKKIEAFTSIQTCDDCLGKRYNETTLSSKILGYNIYDMTTMQLDELVELLKKIEDKAFAPIVKSILERLENLIDIGLDYLSLTRETSTLSGGESQRVKMVKHLSSSLTDVMYIFDEPSIGLHSRDVHRLNELLLKIRDKGNTVIVVEHDPDVIKIADHIVDVGPKAGAQGGNIVFEGSYDDLKLADTLTGRFLGKRLAINENPRISHEYYETKKSSIHNLKNASLQIPKGLFTVVTGVAGSGKSTIINEVFIKDYPEAVVIDQSDVSANIRSNSATYTGIMDLIRQIFADENKVSAGLFSYNSEGACPNCGGTGIIETDLSFMDAMKTVCEVCGGKRYKKDVLVYQYRGKNIVDIMEMSITEANEFFEHKEIRKKLKSILDVGLQYMTLGQPLNTLSGGECQRLKLAKELNKKGNIYIMDEPTTGLHMSDITNILSIIDRLVKKGNTVVVIEHNLDIIRRADWIIDMGPDGGNRGGEVLYSGNLMGLRECNRSTTGKYL